MRGSGHYTPTPPLGASNGMIITAVVTAVVTAVATAVATAIATAVATALLSQVQIEGKYDARQEHSKDRVRCILKVGQRDLHWSELGAPSNAFLLGRWCLESDGVPIGGLDVLKVICVNIIVQLYSFLETDHWVTDEQVSNVLAEQFVQSLFLAQIVQFIVNWILDIIVLGGCGVWVQSGFTVANVR